MTKLSRRARFGAAAAAASVSLAEPVSATGEQLPPYQGDLPIYEDESPDSCDPSGNQVRVVVEGVEARGILTVEIFAGGPDRFLEDEGRLRRVRVPAEDGSQLVCMNVDVTGPFAVTSYHDANGNRKVDKNLIGIPKERIGLSNNPELKLKRPDYDQVKFELGMHGIDLWVRLQEY
ncbi:MAG: DUF2141 domain-containing protein [Pseudomonadota bacterium]